MNAIVHSIGLLVISNTFVPFALFYMREQWSWNYLWAGLCLLGATSFIFREPILHKAGPAATVAHLSGTESACNPIGNLTIDKSAPL